MKQFTIPEDSFIRINDFCQFIIRQVRLMLNFKSHLSCSYTRQAIYYNMKLEALRIVLQDIGVDETHAEVCIVLDVFF